MLVSLQSRASSALDRYRCSRRLRLRCRSCISTKLYCYPQLAVAVLEKVLDACSSPDEVQAMQMKYGHDVILVEASIAGKLAIPVLRVFASLPKHNDCTSSTFDAAARTALAKFGDESAYAVIKKQWAQHRGGPYPA